MFREWGEIEANGLQSHLIVFHFLLNFVPMKLSTVILLCAAAPTVALVPGYPSQRVGHVTGGVSSPAFTKAGSNLATALQTSEDSQA